jgi:2-succinyl-6-hydroxy-2,4-cyclohexadiene-1-carboxylate synthase
VNYVHSVFVDAGGLRLHARIVLGPKSELRPVVFLHGFTGSTESMRGAVAELCEVRETLSIDLVGHGCSDAPEDLDLYSIESCSDQIAKVIDEQNLDRPHLLGYSMGGRAALAFCIFHPELASSALVVGANAGLADANARRERIRSDEALADRNLEFGVEEFVEDWMANPLFASQARLGPAALETARLQRMKNRPEGLARSLRGMGTGAMPPLALSEIKVPLCFVAGAEDEKFAGLARAYASQLPGAACEIVPGAGHAVHLEAPEMFGQIARQFFSQVEQG